MTTWSGSFTRLGRKVGCLWPQGLAPPSAGYGPQTPKGSPLPGMLTSRPTEAIGANMLIFPLKYLQTLQIVSACDIGMQSWIVAASNKCMRFVELLDCAQLWCSLHVICFHLHEQSRQVCDMAQACLGVHKRAVSGHCLHMCNERCAALLSSK